MLIRRDYQQWTNDAFFRFFETHPEGHPVLALPTGTGKSFNIADLSAEIITMWNGQRILVLAPTKELVQQDAAKLAEIAPQIPFGICSASLGKYELGRPVTFGTIGTVINRKTKLGKIDLCFVDECHLVSDKETTQYRQLFDYLLEENPHIRFIGLSATPWRIGVGHIIDGGLFTHIAFDATTRDAFNWFIDQGYLLTLIPRPTRTKLSTEGVKTQSGDFQAKALQNAVNKEEITRAALLEAVETASDRNHILVFSTGIEHAEAIGAELEALGESVVVIHSESSTRDVDLAAFKAGDVRWCVNYGILTTGFDFPELDCIIMLRPTKSPGLWVQMLGRGTRPAFVAGFDLTTVDGRLQSIAASGKQNCLVLDFAYNTASLGPINDPRLPKKKGKGGGSAPVKTCKRENTVPDSGRELVIDLETGEERKGQGCGIWNHPSARFCINCGAEFIFDVKFGQTSSQDELIAGAFEKPVVNEYNVTRVTYERHKKQGSPDSIRVNYHCGLRRFAHYVLPMHPGNPKARSRDWWMRHGGGVMPATTDECLERFDTLRIPTKIFVWENRKYPQVMNWQFAEEPAHV